MTASVGDHLTPQLTAQDVTLTRGDAVVLSHVSLTVQPGTLTVLVGPNGSGKSSLLSALAGLIPPSSGSITLDGHTLADLGPLAVARNVASLGQDERPDDDLTALEVALLGRAPHLGAWGLPSDSDVERARAALAQQDALDFAQRRMRTLSGGERQRVLLARTASQATPVVLLDEPTSALDVKHARTVMDLLVARARAGDAVLAAVHDLALAARHAQAWVVLGEKGVLHAGPLERAQLNALLPRAFGVPLQVEDVRGTPVVVIP
jgi:iron complex transport system ATP-binding protein